MEHLQLVLERFRIHELHCGLKKCTFAKTEVEYLGHLISANKNRAHPKHIQQLPNFPRPRNVKQERWFLGVAGWLREFIPQFSKKAAPLTDLLGTKKKFIWNREAELAFEKLKEEASRDLILSRPNFKNRFILQTDASKVGMAAVLYQEEEGEKKIISYISAKFNNTEKNYHINEAECYAAVWAIKKYKAYLEGNRFVLRTDSRSLTWLEKFKETKQKFIRWALLLQEFDFDIEHVSGKHNELPDYLSRNPEESMSEECIDESVEHISVPQIEDNVEKIELVLNYKSISGERR